jgi:signal transduction histidine kinase
VSQKTPDTFNRSQQDQAYDTDEVYYFVLLMTWLTVFSFAIAFFVIKAWFSFTVVLLGATIVLPLCLFFARTKNPTAGRVFYIIACNLFVLLGSLGCNHLMNADLFFLAISISSVILFRADQKFISVACVSLIVLAWLMMQLDPKLLIPESWIVTQFPVRIISGMSFIGALSLSASYLFIHVRALEGHHFRVQKSAHKLNLQRLEALDLLTKMANNIPGVVYQFKMTSDGQMSFPYASHGIKKIYRLTPDQVQDSADSVMNLVQPDDLQLVIQTIQESAKNLSTWHCDFRIQFKDEGIEWRRGVAQPQQESDGSTLWHGFIMDITNEKKLEHDLHQSQVIAIHNSRLASLGEMAGGIAHEINNPLSIISSKASLIQLILNNEEPQIERAKSELEKLVQTTFRIAGIVKGLLTFARGDKNVDYQNISVEDILNDVSFLCGEKAKAKGIDIQFQAKKDLTILGSSVQIAQVILNLVNNSMDAIPTEKEPWIKVEAQPSDSGEHIRFSVTDCGSGINPQQLEKLMQPFFTTKSVGQGTGLGLSISRGLVESHGGTLTYDQNSRHTRFYFDLKNTNSSLIRPRSA